MNIAIGQNCRNKKNTFEYIVPPPTIGVGTNIRFLANWLLMAFSVSALRVATSPPFTWPETLSLRDHYQFYVRFVIHCGLSNNISKYQYSSWASVSVKASVPELSVTQIDETTAAINVSKYEEFFNLRSDIRDPKSRSRFYEQTQKIKGRRHRLKLFVKQS